MTKLIGLRAVAVASLLLLSAACARQPTSAGPAEAAPEISHGDALVLRVEHVGGFVTPVMLAARLPMISVYADGRMITEGPQILIYPGPALPNVQVQQLDPVAVTGLVERAVAAGVRSGQDLGQPAVADAPTTRFTLVTAAGRQVLDVPALAEATDAPGTLTADQVAARTRLRTFVDQLGDLPRMLGSGTVGEVQPYEPTVVAAIAAKWQPVDEPVGSAQPARPWPGPALPGDRLGQGDAPGCVTVTGDAVAKVLAAAKEANALTAWSSAGDTWTVAFRPLLPDEVDCDDLGDAA